MTSKPTRIAAFHRTSAGCIVFGLGELALAYVFASWAIDSGSLIDWFLAIVLLVGGVQNLIKLIVRQKHDR